MNQKNIGSFLKILRKEKLFRCKSSSIYTFVYVFSSRDDTWDIITGIRHIYSL